MEMDSVVEQYSVDPQTGKDFLLLKLMLQIRNLIELGQVADQIQEESQEELLELCPQPYCPPCSSDRYY